MFVAVLLAFLLGLFIARKYRSHNSEGSNKLTNSHENKSYQLHQPPGVYQDMDAVDPSAHCYTTLRYHPEESSDGMYHEVSEADQVNGSKLHANGNITPSVETSADTSTSTNSMRDSLRVDNDYAYVTPPGSVTYPRNTTTVQRSNSEPKYLEIIDSNIKHNAP